MIGALQLEAPVFDFDVVSNGNELVVLPIYGGALQLTLLCVAGNRLIQQATIAASGYPGSPRIAIVGDRYALLWISHDKFRSAAAMV